MKLSSQSAAIHNTEIEDTKKYLQELSQCAYNIKIIICIHSAESYGYLKELNRFYRLEKARLKVILSNPAGVDAFPFDQSVLTEDLIDNDYDTHEAKENLMRAKKELLSLLTKIQIEREKTPTYTAKTGLENGDLKEYIVGLIKSGSKIYPMNLLGLNENFIIKDGEEYKYNKKQIIFDDKNRLYYHIFDIIFSKQDPVYVANYSEINTQLRQRGLNKKNYAPRDIRNAFTNTIWKKALLFDGSKMKNENGKSNQIVDFKRKSIYIDNTY